MRLQEDLPLGAECAWPVPPKSSLADRAGLAVVALLLVFGAWLARPRLGIERYVLEGAGSARFALLHEIRPGGAVAGERLEKVRITYQVGRAGILDRHDLWTSNQAAPTRLTLITLYPFDALRAGKAQRYVLLAFLS